MTTQKTILIVEDEKMVRDVVGADLKDNNFLVLEAPNGKKGVEVALEKHPDLILLDLLMPEMDGMTALKNIRADSWGAHVPVIILTNLSATDEKLVEDIVTHKPMEFIIKSDIKMKDLIARIEKILV